jgi:hypothetical protein
LPWEQPAVFKALVLDWLDRVEDEIAQNEVDVPSGSGITWYP